MDPSIIVQLIVNGLLIGGIYSLVSMGLTLIWGVMNVVNFAQGELLMIGMYIAWLLNYFFGFSPYLSVIVCFIGLFLIGLIIEKFLVSRVIELSMAARIYVTFGLSLFLSNLMLMLMGAQVRAIPSETSTLIVGSIFIDVPHLISFVFSIFTAFGMYLFLMKSRTGKALRAVSQNRVVASSMGINVHNMYLIAFGIGAALTGIAGSLIMGYYSVTPTVGTAFMLSAFAAIVLGSMGNFEGAFFAGLIIGVAETVGGYFIGPDLKQAASFVILVVILMIRPTGLFGKELGKERVKQEG
ncbi:MAG: branched-chain amino acid ABC transporter permease [Candidatus Bathyarchaeia archaeon]